MSVASAATLSFCQKFLTETLSWNSKLAATQQHIYIKMEITQMKCPLPSFPEWSVCLQAQRGSRGHIHRPSCEPLAESTCKFGVGGGGILLDRHSVTLQNRPEGKLGLRQFPPFQTFIGSPGAGGVARLSELKASVRTSVRWPPSVRRAVLLAMGVLSEVFRL